VELDINNVIFLKNDIAATYYRENIFPHNIESIIVTADYTWPKDEKVRNFIWEQIKTDKLDVIAIGTDHLDMVNNVTHLFVIDKFISNDIENTIEVIKNFGQLKQIKPTTKLVNPKYNTPISTLLGYEFKIKEISFKEIKEIWDNKLWPGLDSFKVHVDSNYPPATDEPDFFGLYDNNKLIGVNSGYATGMYYRSRGLWVDPNYRGMGLSKLLLEEVINQAKLHFCKEVWSLPSKKFIYAFTAAGFTYDKDYEENKYVRLVL